MKSEKVRLVLIRHAQATGQEPDADLTVDGRAQALALIPRLNALGVREVFTSPYRRALATIAPFAENQGMPIQVIENLRERKLANGRLPDFLVHMERSFADENYCLDGGESLAQTTARGRAALREVICAARTPNPAVASHGNLIAAVLRGIDPNFSYDTWRTMRNPHLFELELENGAPMSFRDLG